SFSTHLRKFHHFPKPFFLSYSQRGKSAKQQLARIGAGGATGNLLQSPLLACRWDVFNNEPAQ
ncbi:MAG: hypothetical protein ACFNO3_03240, partial [Alloprevotella tannerae]